jgi:signal transduction histidine kinase/ActR/RegA family two-component response regulator
VTDHHGSALRRRVVAVAVVLIAAFAVSSAYDAWRSYNDARAGIERELTTLSRALAEEAARRFESIDVLLRDTASWYQASGEGLSAEHAHERLAALASGASDVIGLMVRGADGLPLYSWTLPGAVPPDALPPANPPRGEASLRTGETPESELDRQDHLVLSRGVARGGRLVATVSAFVDLEQYRRFYRAIDLGAGNAIALARDDGLLLARQPARSLRPSGERQPEAADRGEPFVATSTVRGYPFQLIVSREEAVALGPWREQMLQLIIRTTALTLLGLLLVNALVRQIARGEAAKEEQARLVVELRQAHKMEAMGALAGGIAHDFNNILGAILGYGELAQKHLPPTSGGVRRYLEQVLHAGRRGKALVERILAFSRSGFAARAPVHVQSVVEEALELLAASLPPQVRLDQALRAGDAAVTGDATLLHQVAMNLCTNAVRAMKGKGVLAITLERAILGAPRTFSHGALAPGAYVRLAVADTGAGIAPAVYEHMFDPFFTTQGVGEGTGLGLAMVHGIVTDLGGAIDVRTVRSAGSTFEVWLPSSGETPRPTVDATRELPHGRGEAVMIVDDEPPLVTLAEETLAELGYEPVGYDSSTAALEAFRAEPQRFDLVLTDETMPQITGSDLARELRLVRPALPVILMSGYGGALLGERARAAGVREVLHKPLGQRELAEALARALGRKDGLQV